MTSVRGTNRDYADPTRAQSIEIALRLRGIRRPCDTPTETTRDQTHNT